MVPLVNLIFELFEFSHGLGIERLRQGLTSRYCEFTRNAKPRHLAISLITVAEPGLENRQLLLNQLLRERGRGEAPDIIVERRDWRRQSDLQ
jgi:hypothetical protein